MRADFFPFGFIIFFAAMWCAVLYVFSRLSGWAALAERYRAAEDPIGERLMWASATLGGVSFRNCLNITLGASGLHLVPSLAFRLFMPPLLVPWSDVRFEGFEKVLFSDVACLRLGGAGGPIFCAYRDNARRFRPFLSAQDQRDYDSSRRFEGGMIDRRIVYVALGAAALGLAAVLLAAKR